MNSIIRNYEPRDFETIAAIHESTGIDYKMPDLSKPIFLVKKVLEVDGVIRMALGAYIQVELYLWLDKTDWATPQEKFDWIKTLEKDVLKESWEQGVDCAVLYLPPSMERFGERLVEDFGWTRPREGWYAFSKQTSQEAGQ